MIEKYNVDAFRYWVGSAGIGSDLPFKEQELVAGQRFLTKLWNSSKFVILSLKDYKNNKPKKFEEIDKYMLQKTSEVLDKVEKHYKSYNISAARREIEHFFWHFFCDNYLEIVKKRIYNGKGDKKLSAQYVLYQSLLAVLKMMAPITCFLTEEIYQQYFRKFEKDKSIHVSKWPELKIKEDKKLEAGGNKVVEVLSKIRQEKSTAQKPMNSKLEYITLPSNELKILKPYNEDLMSVSGAVCIKEGKFGVKF